MPSVRTRIVLAGMGVGCLLVCGQAAAQYGQPAPAPNVELEPFAGLQYGGSFVAASGRHASLGAGLDYGATLDVHVSPSWCVEVLYSRQQAGLDAGGIPFDTTVERLMGGIVEEQGDGPSRFFGVVLFGATRFVPALSGYGSSTQFTIGLGLGVKHRFDQHLGIRAEARGFYAITETGGGLFCSGGCLFTFSGSGLWQGDLTAGVMLAF